MGRKRKFIAPEAVINASLPPCRVCDAPGAGFHYGANTCEACKGFFHRSQRYHPGYRCIGTGNCVIGHGRAKLCQWCRYSKCLAVGMSRGAIKTGRYTSAKRTRDIVEVKQLAEKRKLQYFRFKYRPSYLEESDSPEASCDQDYKFGDDQCSQILISPEIPDPYVSQLYQGYPDTPDDESSNSNEPFVNEVLRSLNSSSASLKPVDMTTSRPMEVNMASLHLTYPVLTSLSEGASLAKQNKSPSHSIDVAPKHSSGTLLALSELPSNPSYAGGLDYLQLEEPPKGEVMCPGLYNPTTGTLCCQGPGHSLASQKSLDWHSHPAWGLSPSSHPTLNPAPLRQPCTQGQQSPTWTGHESPTVSQAIPSPSSLTHARDSDTSLWSPDGCSQNTDWNSFQGNASVNMSSPSCSCTMVSNAPPSPACSPSRIPSTMTSPSVLELNTSELFPLSDACNDYHDIVPKSCNGCHDNVPKVPCESSTTADDAMVCKTLYQDSDDVVNQLLNAHDRYLAQHFVQFSKEEMKKMQDEHMEHCQLKNNVFGNGHISIDEFDEIYRTTGIDTDGRVAQMISFTDAHEDIIRSIVKFSKSIPGFSKLQLQEKIHLIKHSRAEFILFSTYHYVDCDRQIIRIGDGNWRCSLDVIETDYIDCESWAQHFWFFRRLQRLDLKEDELTVLKAMIITNPDRDCPATSNLAQAIHWQLTQLFIEVLGMRRARPLQTFAHVINCLTEARQQERMILTMIRNMNWNKYLCLKDKPLIVEMFSDICPDPPHGFIEPRS